MNRSFIEAAIEVLQTSEISVQVAADGTKRVILNDGTANGTEVSPDVLAQIESLWQSDGFQNPPPSTDPNDYPLIRFQFEAFAMAGLSLTFADIEAAIKALGLPTLDEAVAISRLRNATTYNRSHPLIGQLAGPLGKTDAEINAAWMLAKDLK